MTVSSTHNRKDFVAGAGQTTFAYDFKIFANPDLYVGVNGVLKTLTTDYTVTGAGNPAGGNVVFNSGLTAGNKVVIIRVMPLTQLTDYVENDPFPAQSHEDALDRLAMLGQQYYEVFYRCFRFAPLSTFKDIFIPEPINGGEYLRWNPGKTAIELANDPAFGTYIEDRGDPSAYDWNQSNFICDGVWRDLDCSEIAGNTLVPAGAKMIEFAYQGYTASSGGAFDLLFRKKGNVNVVNMDGFSFLDNNKFQTGKLRVPCNSNRVIQYRGSNGGVLTSFSLTVSGWIF